MPNESSGGDRRRARVIASLAGGLLAVTGAVTIGVGVAGQEPAPPAAPQAEASESATPSAEESPAAKQQPSTEPKPEKKSQSSEESATRAAGLDYSEPVRVSIPKVGSSSTLEDLGLDSDGVMTTPQDPDKAGWFTPSPPPGVAGVSVIAGHVTWNQEPAVFFELGALRKGDQVEVERKDGVTVVYEVTKLGEFPKDEFPTDAVYQPADGSELRLITCGGEYDEESNDYASNVIVWADMVDTKQA